MPNENIMDFLNSLMDLNAGLQSDEKLIVFLDQAVLRSQNLLAADCSSGGLSNTSMRGG